MKRRHLLTAVPALIASAAFPALAVGNKRYWEITLLDDEVAGLSDMYCFSTNEKDTLGYYNWTRLHAEGLTIKTTCCNGVKLRGIQAADAKEGWARGATYDDDGDVIFVKDLDEGYFPEQTYVGRITFEFEKYS